MNAGDRLPFATSLTEGSASSKPSKRQRIRRRFPGMTRKIEWAVGDPDKNRRGYAVGHLYPRILYTFSDVIVFVQRNPK